MSNRQGFTIVELMLAMAGLSMLLLLISLLTVQVSKIYSKGLTLRSVNEAGQLLIQDMKQSINSVALDSINVDQVDNGRLCIGSTIYAWNLAGGGQNGIASGAIGAADQIAQVRFVKLSGRSAVACAQGPPVYSSASPILLDATGSSKVNGKDIKKLLSPGDSNLVMHNFSVSKAESGTNLVQVSFRLGTDTSDLLNTGGDCQPGPGGGDEFCAVNQFTFTARAGSVVK